MQTKFGIKKMGLKTPTTTPQTATCCLHTNLTQTKRTDFIENLQVKGKIMKALTKGQICNLLLKTKITLLS